MGSVGPKIMIYWGHTWESNSCMYSGCKSVSNSSNKKEVKRPNLNELRNFIIILPLLPAPAMPLAGSSRALGMDAFEIIACGTSILLH